MDFEELEAAFDLALQGADEPALMAITCEECGKTFCVPTEPVCEHLRTRLHY